MKRRRRFLVVIAALALAVPVAVALPAAADPPKDPPPCATGQFTSAGVQELAYSTGMTPRVYLRLEGWVGPCSGGQPLPNGYRKLSYYRDGAVVHDTVNPHPFTSTNGPTTFGGYLGVDMDRGASGGPLVAVCLAYNDTERMDCLAPDGYDANGIPIFEKVPTSYVTDHVSVWPPNQIAGLHPDPTCGTCV